MNAAQEFNVLALADRGETHLFVFDDKPESLSVLQAHLHSAASNPECIVTWAHVDELMAKARALADISLKQHQ